MTRKKKLLLNMSTGLLKQLVTLICGFILPRFMLQYFGSELNGLVSSITHFLGFITLSEMGIGPVIQANLYEPLAKKDHEQISRVFVSSQRFFRRIAYIFVAYIVVLIALFPCFINKEYDPLFTGSLIVIISISTFAEYFIGMSYQFVVNADQKAYISLIPQMLTTIGNAVICVLLMIFGASIHVVKLVSSLIFVLRPLWLMYYVGKYYHVDKKIQVIGEPIKQKWNGFSQHLAAVVSGNIDVVSLTLFSTLTNVSIYSVYHLVTSGVNNIIMTAATGLESMFGNMLANHEDETVQNTFELIEWALHTFVTLIFTIMALTIVPFVQVYTQGIADAELYVVPTFAILMVLAFGVQCLRVPYFRIIKAAGHFKQTQNGAFISTAINVVVSIAMVFRFGLNGIALGTLIAFLYHTLYFVWYLKSNILNRPIWYFVKHLCVDGLIGMIVFFLTKGITLGAFSYLSWILMAIKVSCVTLLVAIAVNAVFYNKMMMKLIKQVMK